jgi:hypothetical protein
MKAIYRKFALLAALNAAGAIWLLGCVTDLQARDFFTSTAVRVFYQTLGSAFQSAFVNAFGQG